VRRWFSTHSFTVLSSRTAHARICLSRSSLISIVFIPHSYQRGRGVESLNGGAGSKVGANCQKRWVGESVDIEQEGGERWESLVSYVSSDSCSYADSSEDTFLKV